MKLFVAIDDTDSPDSRGTGHLAAELIARIEQKGWGVSSFITRHQLFVHPDVPYTSHNSAMCFTTDWQDSGIDGLIDYAATFLRQNSAMCFTTDWQDSGIGGLIDYAATFLRQNSAPGSDPGLCIATAERLPEPAALVDFGDRAKREVLTKEEAYALAAGLHIHISEHGGTGGGIIGALAGVGLRLGGNDGRIRGRVQFQDEQGIADPARLCSSPAVARVQSLAGETLAGGEKILLGEKVKTVLLDNEPVLLVAPLSTPTGIARWRTCTKEELHGY